jgi:WD40 repeat protein
MFSSRCRHCLVPLLALTMGGMAWAQEPRIGHGKSTNKAKAVRVDANGDPLPRFVKARLGTMRFRNVTAALRLLRYAPDGKTLLSLDHEEIARVWEASTGRETYHFRVPSAYDALLTPGFGILVDSADDRSIRIQETATGKVVRTLHGNNRSLTSAALAPNGKTLAAIATDANKKWVIRRWEIATGKELGDIVPVSFKSKGEEFEPRAVSFAGGGKAIAVSGACGPEGDIFRFWESATGKELPVSGRYSGQSPDPTVSPDGVLLLTLAREGDVKTGLRLLSLATGKKVRDLGPALSGWVVGARFSPDSRYVAVVVDAQGDWLHFWNVATGKHVRAQELGKLSSLYTVDLAWASDSETVAVKTDRAVLLMSALTGKRRHKLKNMSPLGVGGIGSGRWLLSRLPTVAFSPDGKRVAAEATGHRIRVWDVVSGTEIPPARAGHEDRVVAFAVSPDGKRLASVGNDAMLRLWDLPSGRQTRVEPVPWGEGIRAGEARSSGNLCVAFSPDGTTIAAGSIFNIVRFWDATTGQKRLQFRVPDGGVRSLTFTADSKRLITGGTAGVHCWDARTAKQLHQIVPPSEPDLGVGFIDTRPSSVVAISPDGRLLAATRSTPSTKEEVNRVHHELCLWELATGQIRRRHSNASGGKGSSHLEKSATEFRHRNYSGTCMVAFASDGRTLAWNQGQTIELWDQVRGKPLRQLPGSVNLITGMAFLPGRNILATVSYDGLARFWDCAHGTLLGTARAPRGGFTCIAFSPDGRTAFTGGEDSTVLLWDVEALLKEWRTRDNKTAAGELMDLWDRLGDLKGEQAAEAMRTFVEKPKETLILMRDRLSPTPGVDGKRIERLIADLEDRRFQVRKRAQLELEKLAELAEPFLDKRLKEKPALETWQRLEQILAKGNGLITLPAAIRELRAVEVLERIGTPETLELLRKLAKGAPEARLTMEAKLALARLNKRSADRP